MEWSSSGNHSSSLLLRIDEKTAQKQKQFTKITCNRFAFYAHNESKWTSKKRPKLRKINKSECNVCSLHSSLVFVYSFCFCHVQIWSSTPLTLCSAHQINKIEIVCVLCWEIVCHSISNRFIYKQFNFFLYI